MSVIGMLALIHIPTTVTYCTKRELLQDACPPVKSIASVIQLCKGDEQN